MNTQQIEEIKKKILSQLETKGPLLAVEVARAISLDSIMAGALLAELLKSGNVKISSAKIGSSHVYYLPGSEAKLERLYPYLNEKDRRAYDELRKSKVLKEDELTPLLRVSIQSLHDFALPLDIRMRDSVMRFWKWHLTANDEAMKVIKSSVGSPQAEEDDEDFKTEEKMAVTKKEAPLAALAPQAVKEKAPERNSEEKSKEKAEEKPKQIERKEEKAAEKKESTQTQAEKELKRAVEKAQSDIIIPKKLVERELKEKMPILPQQTTLEAPTQELKDVFHEQVAEYFKEKNIIIKSQSLIKKGKEMEYLIDVPSSLGSMTYYCAAKNKKTFNEGDISSAYVKGMKRKVGVLFLTTGKASKKTMEKLREEFPDVLIRNLE